MNCHIEPMTKLVSQDNDLLSALKLATKDLGIDLNAAAMTLGLPPNLLENADQFVASQLFNCLLQAIAKDHHCPQLAVHIAQHMTAPSLGLPTRIMGLSKTLGDALAISTQYGAFYRDTAHWQHQIGDQGVVLFKAKSQYQKDFSQRSLLGTAQMHLLLKMWNGPNWQAQKVTLCMAEPHPRALEYLQNFFSCKVEFDCECDGFYFPIDSINNPVIGADDQLLYGVLAHIDNLQQEISKGTDVIDQARLVINQRLNFAHCSQQDLAHHLEITSEQLSAELRQSNITFDQLSEQQITEKALYYLTELHAPIELILVAFMPHNQPRLNELLMTSLDNQSQW